MSEFRDNKAACCSVSVLEDIVINQIAAGEVVERPSSVVKELVENALDAGAREVTVAIENGGKTRIEVIDDGSGMSKENALLAIERFGTSKISSAEDLLSIQTFGFRGEALPSIAAVSKMSIATCSQALSSDSAGVQILIEGGVLKEVNETKLAPGTRVLVRQLFYNVPARKGFLRTERTESTMVRSILHDFAAACPEVRFRMVNDGVETVLFHKASSFLERAKQTKAAGRETMLVEAHLPVSDGALEVQGLLSKPIGAGSGASKLRLLVNGRAVRDKLLLAAVRDGYGAYLKPGKYPAGILRVDIPPEDVDVNVHPQKSEVRFRRSSQVFAAVSRAIKSALGQIAMLPEDAESFSPQHSGTEWREGSLPLHRPSSPAEFFLNANVQQGAVTQGQDLCAEAAPGMEECLSSMRFVGQIFHCYLLMESSESLYIVDMHAAHERIVFCRLKEQLLESEEGCISSQAELLPEVLELPAELMGDFDGFREALFKLGFEVELFGENSIIVRSTPVVLKSVPIREIFDDLLSLPTWADWQGSVNEKWDLAIARLACHSSIRSGRDLEAVEVYKLLEDLETATASAFCPHGRPVVRKVTEAELEGMFGRVSGYV